MRQVTRFGWAVAVGLAAASGAIGQTTGTGTTGTSTTSTGTGTSTGSSDSSITDSTLSTLFTAGQINQVGIGSNAISQPYVNTSNQLGTFFANPYYQGRAGADLTNNAPGGFGTPLYTTTSGTGTTGTQTVGTTGLTANRGMTGTSTTGLPGTTNLTLGGSTGRGGGTTTLGGQVIAPPRNIAYTASLMFTVPPAAVRTSRMETDIRGVLSRSVVLSNPAGIEATAAEGGLVVLRGTVRDEDEARLAEGMIRLTPGVYEVKNELVYPRP